MVCRLTFTVNVPLTILYSRVGTWQTHKTAVTWTQPTSVLPCISSKLLCRDNSPLSQRAFPPASTIWRLESSTRSRPIRLVAAYSPALPRAVSRLVLFNLSTRVGHNLSSLVGDLHQVFPLDLFQSQDRARSTNLPPLAYHRPHSGISPPRRRQIPIRSSTVSIQRRMVTSNPMPRFLS